jgi:hypothetical protein
MQFQHHDRDDHGNHAVGKSLQPGSAHLCIGLAGTSRAQPQGVGISHARFHLPIFLAATDEPTPQNHQVTLAQVGWKFFREQIKAIGVRMGTKRPGARSAI